jgi:hypothetical protein
MRNRDSHMVRLFGASLSAAVLLFSCENLPSGEVNEATNALESAAKDPDIVTYAPDSLRLAREKMATLQNEMRAQSQKPRVFRRYEGVKTLALEVQKAVGKASAEASTVKEHVKAEATDLLEALRSRTIPAYESQLWAAKRVRGIKLEAKLLTLADQARLSSADAEENLLSGSYAAAKAKALAVKDTLTDGMNRLAEEARLAKGL